MATNKSGEHWIRTSIDDQQSALLLGDGSADVSEKILEMMNTYAPIWREVYIIDDKSDNSVTSAIRSDGSHVSHNINWIDTFDNTGNIDMLEGLKSEINSVQSPSHIDIVFFINATTMEKYFSCYEITEILEQIQSLSDFSYIYADVSTSPLNSFDYLTSAVDQVATYNNSSSSWDKTNSDTEYRP